MGAKGDVVRTLSILPKIKKVFPESEITWITKDNTKELFYNNPHVDNVLSSDENINDDFDILLSLDMDKEASDMALKINAKEKKGFFIDGEYPAAFNIGAEYYVNTFFDDELKKENNKTVQEMYFMASDLDYSNEHCPIFLSDEEKEIGENFKINNFVKDRKIVGIHIDSSSRWPSRFWTEDYVLDFVRLAKKADFEIMLFGSPKKEGKMQKIIDVLYKDGIRVNTNNGYWNDRQFFSLVNMCDMMITPDSFSMHVSLALKKPTITLFFCTSPYEIESYGILKKIVSSKLYDFFPQRMNEYSEELVKSISPEEVLKAVAELEDTNK